MSPSIRKFLILLLIVGFGMPILPGVAQAERSAVSDSYSVIVPDGWTTGESSGQGTVFTNGDSTLTVFAPDEIANLMTDSADADLKTVFTTVFNQSHDFEADEEAVENMTINHQDAAAWNYEIVSKPDAQGAFIVIRLDKELFAALDIVSPEATFEDSLAAGRDMLGSLTASEESVAAGEPCLVSTESERTATLRVGPGENRTSVAFLPAGKKFGVLGKSADASGNIWFQLDKSDVAPKSSAKEVWVLSNDVTRSGDCDSVVDAAAPPIVPIVQAAPASSASGDSDSGGSGGIVPRAGDWTIVFDSSVPGSCLDNPGLTVRFPLALPPMTTTITDTSASSILVDSDEFTSPQSGMYQGLLTLSDGSSVLFTLRVISDTVMGTEFIITGSFDGTMCSVTVNGIATHN